MYTTTPDSLAALTGWPRGKEVRGEGREGKVEGIGKRGQKREKGERKRNDRNEKFLFPCQGR